MVWFFGPSRLFCQFTIYFFFMFCRLTFFALRKRRVPRFQSLSPTLYFFFDLIPTLTLTLHQVPTPNTCLDTCSVRDAFYGVGMLIWVRLIGVLCAFIFLIPCSTTSQWPFKNSNWSSKRSSALETRVPLSPPVFDFLPCRYHIWSLFLWRGHCQTNQPIN
jgi:hypothetical protein